MNAIGPRECPNADGVAFEALPFRLVAVDIGQAGNTMPLQAPVQS